MQTGHLNPVLIGGKARDMRRGQSAVAALTIVVGLALAGCNADAKRDQPAEAQFAGKTTPKSVDWQHEWRRHVAWASGTWGMSANECRDREGPNANTLIGYDEKAGRIFIAGYESECAIQELELFERGFEANAKCAFGEEASTKTFTIAQAGGGDILINGDRFTSCSKVEERDAGALGARVRPLSELEAYRDELLIEEYRGADDECRGGGSEQTEAWCERREQISKILDERGWCYGRAGEFGYEMGWHKCSEQPG